MKQLKPNKRYQKYFRVKYLREDRGRVKIYVVDSLKDNEVLYGEGQGFARSIVYKEPSHDGPKNEIEVTRFPVTYQGFVMNEKTYQKLQNSL